MQQAHNQRRAKQKEGEINAMNRESFKKIIFALRP